jgi:5-methylcytosine-specific restriction endonuclease McrA
MRRIVMSRPWSHRKAQNIRRELDGYLCQFCGSDINVAAHHIFEYSKGGPSTVESMVTVCQKCHLRMIHADTEIEIEKKENEVTTAGKGGR